MYLTQTFFAKGRGKNSPSTLTIKDGRSLGRTLSLTNLCISGCSMMAWEHFFSQVPCCQCSACLICVTARVELSVGDSLKWSWRWSSVGRRPLHEWRQLGITGTDSQSVTCYQPQQGLLPGIPDSKAARCLICAICCCLLAKKNKLTPFKKFSSSTRGLLTGTSWDWHIFPPHAWK